MKALNVGSVDICPSALREGIILHYLQAFNQSFDLPLRPLNGSTYGQDAPGGRHVTLVTHILRPGLTVRFRRRVGRGLLVYTSVFTVFICVLVMATGFAICHWLILDVPFRCIEAAEIRVVANRVPAGPCLVPRNTASR